VELFGNADRREVQALRQIHMSQGHLGWDGLWVGLPFERVRAHVGPKHMGVPRAKEKGGHCGRYSVEATLDHQILVLEFGAAAESSQLLALWVILYPRGDGRLDPRETARALAKRIDNLEYDASSGIAEDEHPYPVYRAPNGEGILIDSRQGIYLGDLCLE
jgi:hypothetical protein